MDLMFGLATVDKMQGDRLGRQLANGWMGWESKRGRQLRALGAKALIALAAWLAPAAVPAVRAQFEHLPWEGFVFYDLIFPLFLFLAGVVLPLAVVKGAVDAVAAYGPRVSLVLKADIRDGFTGELTAKLDRLEAAIDAQE